MESKEEPIQSQKSAVDITVDNFYDNLPSIIETIERCDFIAFDLEFSGTDYKSYFRSVYSDTFETRYAKYRLDVEKFYPIELGICCFTWNQENGQYMSRPYNFFICPYSHKLHNPSLSIRASTLEFLRENNFKFGQLFSEGIPTLRKSDEERILEYQRMRADRYDYKNEKEKEEVMKAVQMIDEWVIQLNDLCRTITPEKNVDMASLKLPLMDSHKRKLLYQEVANRYPSITLRETVEDNNELEHNKMRYSRAFVSKLSTEVICPALPDISKHAGVRTIVETILSAKKPLIGFQTMGDLTYMLGGIYRQLPPTLNQFFGLLEEIDMLIDLKCIIQMGSMMTMNLMNDSLSNAYIKTKSWSCGDPCVVSALMDNAHISIHDAANDAYMTGCLFIKLFYYCGFIHSDLSQLHSLAESAHLTYQKNDFINNINLINLYHMNYNLPMHKDQYNNLINQHPEINQRDTVLVIERIAPWLTSKHFVTFFGNKYGVKSSMFLNWLDDSTMLAVMPTHDVVDRIIRDWKAAISSDDSDTTYYKMPTDFCNRQVTLKDLRVSRYSRYEEMCYVGRYNLNNC